MITAEHYISRSLLQEIGQAPLLSGVPFLRGKEQRIGIASLTAKVLCDQHNQVLSPLDSNAAKTFRAWRRFEENFKDSRQSYADDFALVEGAWLEAWLAKVALGMLAAGMVGSHGAAIEQTYPGAKAVALKVLFHGASWPEGWGLSQPARLQPAAAAADFAVSPLTVVGELWGLMVELGALVVQLGFGCAATPTAVFRPSAVISRRLGDRAEKVLALGWPDGQAGPPVMAMRVGQVDGWGNDQHVDD